MKPKKNDQNTVTLTWHPVSEPVPDALESGPYNGFHPLLLTFPNHSIHPQRGCFLAGDEVFQADDKFFKCLTPTHWMEMPPMPKA